MCHRFMIGSGVRSRITSGVDGVFWSLVLQVRPKYGDEKRATNPADTFDLRKHWNLGRYSSSDT